MLDNCKMPNHRINYSEKSLNATEDCTVYERPHNNIKSIYIAPWLHVTLFRGAVTKQIKKKTGKMLKVKKDTKIYIYI